MRDAPPDVIALPYTVCYADTDAGGVVYHARYVEMAERARNRLLALAGFSLDMLAREYETLLVVHRLSVTYHAPARLEDELMLNAVLTDCGVARSIWFTKVMRADAELACVTAEVVALHSTTRHLRMHPSILLDRLQPFVAIATNRRSSNDVLCPSPCGDIL